MARRKRQWRLWNGKIVNPEEYAKKAIDEAYEVSGGETCPSSAFSSRELEEIGISLLEEAEGAGGPWAPHEIVK